MFLLFLTLGSPRARPSEGFYVARSRAGGREQVKIPDSLDDLDDKASPWWDDLFGILATMPALLLIYALGGALMLALIVSGYQWPVIPALILLLAGPLVGSQLKRKLIRKAPKRPAARPVKASKAGRSGYVKTILILGMSASLSAGQTFGQETKCDAKRVYVAGSEVGLPQCLYCPQPNFPKKPPPPQNSSQFGLSMYIVVGKDGMVSHPDIVNSLGSELDSIALKTISTWKFKPAHWEACGMDVATRMIIGFGPPTAKQFAGVVTDEIPDAQVERAGRAILPLHLNDTVYWDDKVGTSERGGVRVKLTDGSELIVGAASQMTIKSHDPTMHQTEIELLAGNVRAEVVKSASANFRATTPTALIRNAGTKLRVNVVSHDETDVTSIEDDVTVANVDPNVTGVVMLHAGQGAVVCLGEPPSTPGIMLPTEESQSMKHCGKSSDGNRASSPRTPPPPACVQVEASNQSVYSVGGGVSEPIPTYRPDPPYTEEARKAKLIGTVTLQLVIGADGKVRDARVVKALGMGLDEKAVETVCTWRFKPSDRNGVCVPVRVLVEVGFALPGQ